MLFIENVLGVIGGIGSYATSYFYKRLLDKTNAKCDQDYINMIVINHASIPDRTDFLLNNSQTSPLKYIRNDIKKLEKLNVSSILILCNTAYYFYDELKKCTELKIRNLISDTVIYLKENNIKKVNLLATTGTIECGIYQKYCSKYGIECETFDKENQKKIMNIIYGSLKVGKKIDVEAWNNIITKLKDYPIILGCTELSMLKTELKLDDRFIDPIDIQIDLILKDFGREKMDKVKFSLENEYGIMVEYETVCTIDSEDGVHSYICYTDNTKDKDGHIKIYISAYEDNNGELNIFPIETKEEWDWIQKKFYERKEN